MKLRSRKKVALATTLMLLSAVVYYLVSPAWNERCLNKLAQQHDGISYKVNGIISFQKMLTVRGRKNFDRVKGRFGNVLHLHKLVLAKVKLDNSDIQCIARLQLPCLSFKNCTFASDVDWSCFHRNIYLKKLFIDSTGISDENLTHFGQCPKLQRIDIWSDQIRGEFLEGGFDALKELMIRSPSAEAIPAICKLKSIRVLDFWEINFDANELGALGALNTLSTLELPNRYESREEARWLFEEARREAIERGLKFERTDYNPL